MNNETLVSLLETDIAFPASLTAQIDPRIRLARPEDAAHIVPLFYQIWEDMGIPLASIGRDRYCQAMENGIAHNLGRFGFSHVLVYTSDSDQVLGAIASFRGEDEKILTEQTLQCLADLAIPTEGFLFDPESRAGEYYLDSICVDSAQRGQGIGTALLRCHQLLAAFRRVPITLNVDQANSGARALYQRLGFVAFDTCVLARHPYDRMRYSPEQAQEAFSTLVVPYSIVFDAPF